LEGLCQTKEQPAGQAASLFEINGLPGYVDQFIRTQRPVSRIPVRKRTVPSAGKPWLATQSMATLAIDEHDQRIPAATNRRAATANMTIRRLAESLKRRLQIRAAERGRPMEEKAREILRGAVAVSVEATDLGQAIHARFATVGGAELELPARGPVREPPAMS
jgi:antitoxin FitA